MAYATVAEMRAEGVADPPFDDNRIQVALDLATVLIDRATGWWFEPRSLTILLDGRGHDTLYVGVPIIDVTKVEVKGSDLTWDEVDLDDVEVYNRHLSNQTSPVDDRMNPKIVRAVVPPWRRRLEGHLYSYWWEGEKNVRVTGKFGFTDYDTGDTPDPDGVTPPLIAWACKRLAIRELPGMATPEWDEMRERDRIRGEKTRDQSITLGESTTTARGGYGTGQVLTGDSSVDAVLSLYRRPVAARGI